MEHIDANFTAGAKNPEFYGQWCKSLSSSWGFCSRSGQDPDVPYDEEFLSGEEWHKKARGHVQHEDLGDRDKLKEGSTVLSKAEHFT